MHLRNSLSKKIISVFILCMIMASFVFAETANKTNPTPSDMTTTNYLESKYNRIKESPFNIMTSGQDTVSPLTGDLTIRYNDLHLDGINGLDFDLTRYYSLSQSNIYEYNDSLIDTMLEGKYDIGSGWGL